MNIFRNAIELDITEELYELSTEGAVEYQLRKKFGDTVDDYVILKVVEKDDPKANKEGRVTIAHVGYELKNLDPEGGH